MTDTSSGNGFAGAQFQSAVARRKGKGPMLNIEDWVFDGDDDEEGHSVARSMMIDPRLDIIRFGEIFGSYGTELKAVGAAMTGEADDAEGIEKLRGILRKGIARLRDCIVPTHRARLDEVQGAIDVTMMSNIIQWVAKELSPVDPTQPASSSDGSAATTAPSTGGALPVASS